MKKIFKFIDMKKIIEFISNYNYEFRCARLLNGIGFIPYIGICYKNKEYRTYPWYLNFSIELQFLGYGIGIRFYHNSIEI